MQKRTFALQLMISDADWADIQAVDLEFQVDGSDRDTLLHLSNFAETKSCKSLCFLVYEVLCVQEHERHARNCIYFDKFQSIMNRLHAGYRLSEYKIGIEKIVIDGIRFDGVDSELYEWWNYFEAYSDGAQKVTISNGYGDYESALRQIDDVAH